MNDYIFIMLLSGCMVFLATICYYVSKIYIYIQDVFYITRKEKVRCEKENKKALFDDFC